MLCSTSAFAPRCQSEDPAVRWQLNLYRDRALRFEGPPDPEKVLDRIQRISAAVFNLEQVRPLLLHAVMGGVAGHAAGSCCDSLRSV